MSENQIPVSGLVTTTPRKNWSDYKLETHNVFVNGSETNVQAIVYNSKFVNFLSKWYHVLPNEEVIKTADLVAEQLNFKKFSPTKYHKDSWFKSEKNHVISNPDKTQISATYLFSDSVDVTGRGDKVQLGFSVRNAIDGKGGAFSVSPFTHRAVCDNLAFHLAYDKSLHSGLEAQLGSGYYHDLVKLEQSDVLKKQLEDIQKARESFGKKVWKAHFKGLDIGYVTNAILTVKQQAEHVFEQYRKAVDLKIAQAQLESLKARLPVGVHKYASEEVKDSVITYDAKKKTLVADRDATTWQVFNNYTEALSYGQKRNYTTTLENYRDVDKILISPIEVN